MATHATNRFAGPRTGPVEFNFTGGYLDKSHVKCFIENDTTHVRVDVPITASNFLNGYTLDGLPAVEAGHTLVVYRETPANYLVDFANTSRVTEHSLDVSARQGLFKAVEALDATQGGHNPELSPSVAWGNVIGKPLATNNIPGIVKVGAGLSMGADGRLNVTGTSGPAGPAGGVLSGNYPNPGFAQDMATQAELNAGLGGKADTVHTHPLSALTQSGAGIGQVPMWNGAAWAPGAVSGGGGGGTGGFSHGKIVVLGDSESATQPNLGPAWPEHLERLLTQGGAPQEVVNLAINGWTYNRARTVSSFGSKTALQHAIDLNADTYIVALGLNDTIGAAGPVDSRSLAQVQADAAAFYSELRAARPSAVILYLSSTPYDKTHGTLGSLLNRYVMPIHMTRTSSGLLAGCTSAEILPSTMAPAYQTFYSNWSALDTHIKGLPGVLNGELPLWKVARMGGCGPDQLHLTAEGHQLVASAVLEALRTAMPTLMANVVDQNHSPMSSFSGLFSLHLTSSGGQWVQTLDALTTAAGHTQFQGDGIAPRFDPGPWWREYPAALTTSPLSQAAKDPFHWQLTGAKPVATVYASTDGAAWVAVGNTNHQGNWSTVGNLYAAPGTYQFRYKVGNDVLGPVPVTLAAAVKTPLADIEQGGATSGQVLKWNGTVWAPSAQSASVSGCGAGSGLIAGSGAVGKPANTWVRVPFAVGSNLVLGGTCVDSGQDGVNGNVFSVSALGIYRYHAQVLVSSDIAPALLLMAAQVFDTTYGSFICQGTTSYPSAPSWATTATIDVTLRLTPGSYIVPLLYSTSPWRYIQDGTTGGGTNPTHYNSLTLVQAL